MHPSEYRRKVLRHAATLAGLMACAGWPQLALAAPNRAAFGTRSMAEAAQAVGGSRLEESKEVQITGPDVTENSAQVKLGVATALAGVRQLLVFVEKNPTPLAAVFQVSEHIEAQLSVHVKMAQTSDVYAVAILSDGRALWAKKAVQVTIGACGE